jgi:hypothetical protein
MQDDPRTFRWQEEMAKMAACRRVLVGLLQCLAVRQFACATTAATIEAAQIQDRAAHRLPPAAST